MSDMRVTHRGRIAAAMVTITIIQETTVTAGTIPGIIAIEYPVACTASAGDFADWGTSPVAATIVDIIAIAVSGLASVEVRTAAVTGDFRIGHTAR